MNERVDMFPMARIMHERHLAIYRDAMDARGPFGTLEPVSPPLEGYFDAVNKLRKAEKSNAFRRAMTAAANAARAAPSGKQEELAAAAGALSLQEADVTSMEKLKKTIVDGDKLIEVVGFIGVTRPKEKKQG